MPALCFEKACASTLMKKAKWKYLQRLIFFTGAFALILGVYQNLPAMDGIQQPNYMAVVENVDIEYENLKGRIKMRLV